VQCKPLSTARFGARRRSIQIAVLHLRGTDLSDKLEQIWTGKRASLDLITTDVFDTLLLRTLRSERRRIALGEARFAARLRKAGIPVVVHELVRARQAAQRHGFRALEVGGRTGELRLADIISRQLAILGIPQTFAAERVEIELDIEKQSLRPNAALAKFIRSVRAQGTRVVAISDTTLSAADILQLIEHFHGPGLLDHIYTSADFGLTKRDTSVFPAVFAAEGTSADRVLHIGDDPHADGAMPKAMGAGTCLIQRPKWLGQVRKLNGVAAHLQQEIAEFLDRPAPVLPRATDTETFARTVLGPIVTTFCLHIWLYLVQTEADSRPVLLFCSRGGIGIREAFERTLSTLGLNLEARRENLMISRVAAVRGALLVRSRSAIEEMDREFQGAPLRDAASALGGRTYALSDRWDAPFDARVFVDMLDTPEGQEVLRDIEVHHRLFHRHVRELAGDADRIILCDTGLYGSTHRLLVAGDPSLPLETILFARSNYKGFDEAHFPKVVGLIVDRRAYNPLDNATSVLRYWHLIERVFEPKIQSVRTFTEDPEGRVIGNCGEIRFGHLDPSTGNAFMTGALAYVDQLPPHSGRIVMRDTMVALRRLRAAITYPTPGDLALLDVGERSRDFGRVDTIGVIGKERRRSLLARLEALRGESWREGAIATGFPVSRIVLLPLVDLIQTYRGLVKRL
jgi:FMN phosphatase YigB (HAD superfamily)